MSVPDPVLRYHVGNARRAARLHRVDPAIILGILSVEGGTDPQGRPVAPADRMGPPSYGQFTHATGRALNVDFGNSRSETEKIAEYLVQLGYHDDAYRAVAAYNGGPANPQFTYADKVYAAARRYAGARQGIDRSDPKAAAAAQDLEQRDTPSSSIVDDEQRAGIKKAIVWLALAAGGTILAGLGVARSLGARGATA